MKRSTRPPSEWIALSIPPLIDRETFERSQARHGPNQQFSPRNLHEERWLLRQLVRCSNCGLKCACVADKRRPHMPPSYYYRCGPPRLPGRPHCRPSHIRTQPLDALVWEEVRKHLLHPELLMRAQTTVLQCTSLDSSFLSRQLDNAKKRVSRVRAERRRLLDAFQGGFVDKEEFEERARTVARRIEELPKEIETLQEEHQHATEGSQLLGRINEFSSVITQGLDKMSFHERQALVRTVIEEVVVHGNTVRLYFKIPLPKTRPSDPPPLGMAGNGRMSNGFHLRSRTRECVDVGIVRQVLIKRLQGQDDAWSTLWAVGDDADDIGDGAGGGACEVGEEPSVKAEVDAQTLGDGEYDLAMG